jgi:hypothetical protein
MVGILQCCSHVSVDIRYAYAVASALHGVRHILRKDFMLQVSMAYANASCISLFCEVTFKEYLYPFMFQPPWDLEVGKRFIIHYTYGCDYNMKVKKGISLSLSYLFLSSLILMF